MVSFDVDDSMHDSQGHLKSCKISENKVTTLGTLRNLIFKICTLNETHGKVLFTLRIK